MSEQLKPSPETPESVYQGPPYQIVAVTAEEHELLLGNFIPGRLAQILEEGQEDAHSRTAHDEQKDVED